MDPRIRLTLKLIQEHRTLAQFGLAETSRMMGLSQPYLLRLFHREVGTKFQTHLRRERMCRAHELLKRDSQSIKRIAFECGYNDISNFYRDFKREYSVTPREVRLREFTAIADDSTVRERHPSLSQFGRLAVHSTSVTTAPLVPSEPQRKSL